MLCNQMSDFRGVGRDHEMRGAINRHERGLIDTIAQERVGTLHRWMTCTASGDNDGEPDRGQRCC